jgi:branched-chain amino acid transport system ATP-binding protein
MPTWEGKESLLLEAKNISINYGMVKALNEVSFHINQGEIVAMIGPNGAGKSTALKSVSGIIGEMGGQIHQGEILFECNDIKGLRTDQLVSKGMSLVPEGRHVFTSMTITENLEMGAYILGRKQKGLIKERMDMVFELFPVLKERYKQKAGTLSTGEQQMLALGRALMLQPKLLLLDEPSLGLSPNYIDTIFDKLVEINQKGASILLVEQNARMALEICHRAYVFEVGSIALEGNRDVILSEDMVKKVYLGG